MVVFLREMLSERSVHEKGRMQFCRVVVITDKINGINTLRGCFSLLLFAVSQGKINNPRVSKHPP